MSTAQQLWRADLRHFAGYASARKDRPEGDIWLNANEAPNANEADVDGVSRRYPEPQPPDLLERLAALYSVSTAQVLAGRGSDEGIDLLVRGFCAPGRGAVVVAPPVFGMYAVCATLHGARVVEVPLRDDEPGFAADLDTMIEAALREAAALLFLCSPANPTGEALKPEDIARAAQRLRGRCLVVIDEAYGEFSDTPSSIELLDQLDNLVVLRTLSKAHALAGARIGCVVASAEIVRRLRALQAPYPLPAPSVILALRALAPPALAQTRRAIERVRSQRTRLYEALRRLPAVRRAYASQGNFLLARFHDADAALARLCRCGIVVRDMRALPQLHDALRITVGTPAQNDAVVAALAGDRESIP